MSEALHIKRNLMGLGVLGLWDYWKFKNPIKNNLFQIYRIFLSSCFVIFNISQFVDMYQSFGDVSLVMANAGVTLLYFVTNFKVFTIHYHKSRIEGLLQHMKVKENNCYLNKNQLWIYMEYVDRCWFITKLFWFVVASTLTFFYLARPVEFALLGPQEMYSYKAPMVVPSWFPYDEFADGYYTFSYIIQVVCSLTGASYVAVSDTFFIACMIFIIGQFKLIQDRIERLHKNDSNYEVVKEIVKEHTEIINFLDDLNNVIKLVMFINFLICSLMICSVGLEGIISGFSIRFGLNAYYMTALLIQLFLYYWHANEVTLESVNIGHAVSRCRWYVESNPVKKALLLILIRSQKPCTLSVGGFFPMSLEMFLAILKSTYSFLALFRKMYTRQEINNYE